MVQLYLGMGCLTDLDSRRCAAVMACCLGGIGVATDIQYLLPPSILQTHDHEDMSGLPIMSGCWYTMEEKTTYRYEPTEVDGYTQIHLFAHWGGHEECERDRYAEEGYIHAHITVYLTP